MKPAVLALSVLSLALTAADSIAIGRFNDRLAAPPPASAATAEPIPDEVRQEIEALREEAARLRLALIRLMSPDITTEERLREEVREQLKVKDRETLLRSVKAAIDVIEVRMKAHLMLLRDELKLTTEQSDRVKAVLNQFATEFKSAAHAASLDQPVEDDLRSLLSRVDDQVRAELDPAQKERFKGLPVGLLIADPKRERRPH